jgi:hypothetical protein
MGKGLNSQARSLDDWPTATGPVWKWHGSKMAESAGRGGDASVQAGAARSFPSAGPLAKNPGRIRFARGPFSGHLRVAPVYGRRGSFPAMWDSS